MCQNFPYVLLDAFTNKISPSLDPWVYAVPARDDTELCHVSFLLSLSMSVSSSFALSCFWKGQHWRAQTCTLSGTAGMQSEPSSTPTPAPWYLQVEKVHSREAGCSATLLWGRSGAGGCVSQLSKAVEVVLKDYVRVFQTAW